MTTALTEKATVGELIERMYARIKEIEEGYDEQYKRLGRLYHNHGSEWWETKDAADSIKRSEAEKSRLQKLIYTIQEEVAE